ncbi:hypothetical protein RvY_07417 [Ramazzottius varieornatus]|uniref:Receptor ligand binding region domain-containing protein n=1 Tax=Ramazzottius varieornatus TaxID=947166 RepID=A0A1D1V2A7_RAMVA|nr:hypothetical protein RvY_07417 [Ramazzottius varieornatus]
MCADPFAKKEGLASRNEHINLTVCWILEGDSYYSSYARTAAAVDLAITHSNRFILPENVQLQLVYQNAGPSCSDKQYSIISNVLQLMRSGVDCNVFLGVGCPSTAVALY